MKIGLEYQGMRNVLNLWFITLLITYLDALRVKTMMYVIFAALLVGLEVLLCNYGGFLPI